MYSQRGSKAVGRKRGIKMINIAFADGNKLINFTDDAYAYRRCPTCDYGSEYINDVEIRTTNYTIKATFNQMYEYAFSTEKAIRIFAVDLKSMTEKEFVDYVETQLKEIGSLEKLRVIDK